VGVVKGVCGGGGWVEKEGEVFLGCLGGGGGGGAEPMGGDGRVKFP